LVSNMLMLPYPLWFELANLVVIPLGILLGIRLATPPARHSSLPLKEPV
jgi:hypothetical protein